MEPLSGHLATNEGRAYCQRMLRTETLITSATKDPPVVADKCLSAVFAPPRFDTGTPVTGAACASDDPRPAREDANQALPRSRFRRSLPAWVRRPVGAC